MATKTEIMKFLLDHFIEYDVDITATDLWLILDMLIEFLKENKSDEEKCYRIMNNIKALIKGAIYADS